MNAVYLADFWLYSLLIIFMLLGILTLSYSKKQFLLPFTQTYIFYLFKVDDGYFLLYVYFTDYLKSNNICKTRV